MVMLILQLYNVPKAKRWYHYGHIHLWYTVHGFCISTPHNAREIFDLTDVFVLTYLGIIMLRNVQGCSACVLSLRYENALALGNCTGSFYVITFTLYDLLLIFKILMLRYADQSSYIQTHSLHYSSWLAGWLLLCCRREDNREIKMVEKLEDLNSPVWRIG